MLQYLCTSSADFSAASFVTIPGGIFLPESLGMHPANLYEYLLDQFKTIENCTVFTYSSDVFAAVRLMALRGELEQLPTLKYYTKYGVKDFELYSDGGVENWPEGFFDWQEKALLEILESC